MSLPPPIGPLQMSSGLIISPTRILAFSQFKIDDVRLFVGFLIFRSMYTRFVRPDVPRGDEAGRFPAWDHLHSLPRPIHGCHRGGAAAFGPENTMYNYQRCIDELHTHLLEVRVYNAFFSLHAPLQNFSRSI